VPDNAIDELRRLCSEAEEAMPEQLIERSGWVWVAGAPARADEDSVGLRISERVVIHIRVGDIVAIERNEDNARFNVAVSQDARIAVTTTLVLRARLGPGAAPIAALGGLLSGAGAAQVAVARSRPPWTHSPSFWGCLGGEAQTCDLTHGPLYDDRGMLNGELIECYVRGIEGCSRMELALPPER
jgi:hypothetical protein